MYYRRDQIAASAVADIEEVNAVCERLGIKDLMLDAAAKERVLKELLPQPTEDMKRTSRGGSASKPVSLPIATLQKGMARAEKLTGGNFSRYVAQLIERDN